MKITVMKPTEIEVDAIRCELPVRYDEDLEEMGSDFPGLSGTMLTLVLDLERRAVRNWPAGRTASLHMKVVDEGSYHLLSGPRIVASRSEDYVPRCLPQEYGDYFIATIGPDGVIAGWRPDAAEVADAFDVGEGGR